MNAVPLSQETYTKLDSFKGYGRLDAPLWIVGREERTRTAKLEDIEHDLRQRERFEQVMDLKAAHKLLDPNLDLRKTGTRTWLWAAKFARAFIDNARDWDENTQANVYIAAKLGRSSGDTFLTDLYAVPTPPGSGSWPYFGLWNSRKDYELDVWQSRRARLIQLIRVHQPAVVMAYGMDNKMALSSALHNSPDLNSEERMRWGWLDSSLVVLTPFWGTQFNSLTKDEAIKLVSTLKPLMNR